MCVCVCVCVCVSVSLSLSRFSDNLPSAGLSSALFRLIINSTINLEGYFSGDLDSSLDYYHLEISKNTTHRERIILRKRRTEEESGILISRAKSRGIRSNKSNFLGSFAKYRIIAGFSEISEKSLLLAPRKISTSTLLVLALPFV